MGDRGSTSGAAHCEQSRRGRRPRLRRQPVRAVGRLTEPCCGDIWYVEGGGDYLSKGRPALVLHNDAFREVASVTVCLFTSNSHSANDPLLRLFVAPTSANGLDRPSWLMIDKVQTVRKTRLKTRIGHADSDVVDRAIQRILPFMGCTATGRTLRSRLARVLHWGR